VLIGAWDTLTAGSAYFDNVLKDIKSGYELVGLPFTPIVVRNGAKNGNGHSNGHRNGNGNGYFKSLLWAVTAIFGLTDQRATAGDIVPAPVLGVSGINGPAPIDILNELPKPAGLSGKINSKERRTYRQAA
jgi:hypothetical protein